MSKLQVENGRNKTVKSDKFSLQCYISKEAYEKVQELVGSKDKPFRSTSEYLIGLVYSDLGKRAAIKNKTIICNRCGASIDKDSRYCNKCGEAISDDAKTAQIALDGASKNTNEIDILAVLARDLGISKKELQEKLSKK